jgi:type VI secretion system protein ImpA
MLPSELLEPIAGANPAGADVRGEAVFQQIRHARFEEADLPQGEWKRERKTADYVQVVRLATEVLARSSKDLQVAAWLTEAWSRREGFAGLGRGLELLRALLERYWDHVYPELEDGDAELRAAPLEWVELNLGPAVRLAPLTAAGHGLLSYRESRVIGYEEEARADSAKHAEWKAAVEGGKLSADDFDRGLAETPAAWLRDRCGEIDAAAAALEALAGICAERFGADAPSFVKLREALQEVRHVAGQLLARRTEGQAAPFADAPAASATAANGVPVQAVPVEGVAANGASAGGASADARPVAVPVPTLFAADTDTSATPAGSAAPSATASPSAGPPASREDAAARLAALARWLRAERPADPAPYLMLRGFRWGELRADGATPDPRLLVAPPTAERVRLKTLALDERWAELLEAAEEVMAAPYGRGWLDLQRYVAAACAALGPEYDAMRQSVAGALRALLRDLPGLPAMALMDDTPAANAETRAWLAEAGLVDGGAAEAAPAPRLGGAGERARARVAAGEPRKAVEILMDAAAREKSARARFLLRAQAAGVMVDAGLEAVAAPLLKEMAEQVQRHALEEWEEGEVVAHPLALLYRCMATLEDGSTDREALYLRVCRLDPMRAIQLREAGHAAP